MVRLVRGLRVRVVFCFGVTLALWFVAAPQATAPAGAPPTDGVVDPPMVRPFPAFSVPTMSSSVLDLALDAAACATRAGYVSDPSTLTVIDFSLPSTERRLWVLDLATGRELFHELVAHGQGSGEDLATVFSNEPESHRSSLGLFRTAEPYVGKHGYSLRLDGLEEGINHLARQRAIVVHGATYVSDEFVQQQGRLGRSWGCPALGTGVASRVIDRIKQGSLLFAYYPDSAWLNGSPLFGACAAAGGQDGVFGPPRG